MKIYLSHNYSAKPFLTGVCTKLVELGHTITSTWLALDGDDRSPAKLREYALQDLRDIDDSDLLIHFAGQYGNTPGRGKYIEVGYALASDRVIPIIVVMHSPTDDMVFYYMPQVHRVNSLEELYQKIGNA